MPDGHGDGRRRAGLRIGRLRDRPQQRERLEVDPRNLDPRGVEGREVAVDGVPVGDDEQDPPGRHALVVDVRREDVVVDHRLLGRHGEHLVRAEGDRVLELPLVLDPGDLDHPDADAAVAEAEPHALPGQPVLREERAEGLRERGGVAHLAPVQDARLERSLRDAQQPPVAVRDDLRGRQPGGADLEPDELVRRARPLAHLRRLRRARGAPAGELEVRELDLLLEVHPSTPPPLGVRWTARPRACSSRSRRARGGRRAGPAGSCASARPRA